MQAAGIRTRVLGASLLALSLAALTAAPAAAVAPAGKSYASVLIFRNPETRELDVSPACALFSRDEFCTEFGDCGAWEFAAKTGQQNTWRAEITFLSDEGEEVSGEFFGRTERRGPRSSIAATGLLTVDGLTVNAALAGTQLSPSQCLEFGLQDDQ